MYIKKYFQMLSNTKAQTKVEFDNLRTEYKNKVMQSSKNRKSIIFNYNLIHILKLQQTYPKKLKSATHLAKIHCLYMVILCQV